MKKIGLLILVWSMSISLWAQTQTSVFSGIQIYGSARVAALGGNAIALADSDVNLAAINPALIDSTMNNQFAMSYVKYFAQSNLGYSSYAFHPNKSRFAYAATLQYFNYGTSDRLDGLGNNLGSFSSAEYALTLGSSFQVDSLWRIGANLKNMYATYDNVYSYALAVDLAASYINPKKKFAASLVLKNAGMQLVTFRQNSKEALPLDLQFGISKQPKNAPFRFHMAYTNMQRWDITYFDPNAPVVVDPLTGTPVSSRTWKNGDDFMRHMVIGTEILLGTNFKVGIGYNYRQRKELSIPNKPATAGFSFGATFNFKKFQLSYGRAIYSVAGGSNHITFTTTFK
jgi:hypothetical protein